MIVERNPDWNKLPTPPEGKVWIEEHGGYSLVLAAILKDEPTDRDIALAVNGGKVGKMAEYIVSLKRMGKK